MSKDETTPVEVSQLRAFADQLAALVALGWSAHDDLNVVRITSPAANHTSDLLADIAPLGGTAVHSADIVGVRNGHTLRLRLVGTNYEVTEIPEASPEQIFEDADEIERARLGWERDAESALSLEMDWSITLSLNMSLLMAPLENIDYRVCLHADTVRAAFTSSGLTTVARLLPRVLVRRVYIALDAADSSSHLGSVSFASLPALPESGRMDAIEVPPSAVGLAGEHLNTRSVTSLPSPYQLLPTADQVPPGIWQPVVEHCKLLAALATWAFAASGINVSGQAVKLDFLGFKRVVLPLPDTLPEKAISDALTLRRWAFFDASPDRLLAIRQVVSLYEANAALANPTDILASAELIYAGLRSDAVAEVVRGARAAQSNAMDAVSESLQTAQALTKSATERILAAVVGIGAVIVADSSSSLSNSTGRDLLIAIAAFLLLLALSAVFLEGPMLSLPLKNLADNISAGATLLTESQRATIVNMNSVSDTQKKVRIARVTIPIAYLLVALAILLFGFPSRYR